MIAFFDVGNSNVDIYLMDGTNLIKTIKFVTNKDSVDTYYKLQLNEYLKEYNITDGIISSVVPTVTTSIISCIDEMFNFKLIEVTPSMKTNITLKIKEPSTLGADLLCDVVGAKKKYAYPLVICDLGTCTKFLVINSLGEYTGGAIMPGVVASLDSMFNNASLLDKFTIDGPENVIGDDTETCITSGIYYGTSSMIDGMVTKIEEELGMKVKLILTGGLSEKLKDYISHEYTYDKDLLLSGLIELYNLNK